MNTAVELPQEIAALAQRDGCVLESSIQTAVVLDADARGEISAGKAARLLSIDRLGFEDLRIERGISRPPNDVGAGTESFYRPTASGRWLTGSRRE